MRTNHAAVSKNDRLVNTKHERGWTGESGHSRQPTSSRAIWVGVSFPAKSDCARQFCFILIYLDQVNLLVPAKRPSSHSHSLHPPNPLYRSTSAKHRISTRTSVSPASLYALSALCISAFSLTTNSTHAAHQTRSLVWTQLWTQLACTFRQRLTFRLPSFRRSREQTLWRYGRDKTDCIQIWSSHLTRA